jgi:hypothetical protein
MNSESGTANISKNSSEPAMPQLICRDSSDTIENGGR